MNDKILQELAQALKQAELTGQAIDPISLALPELDLTDAYRIQLLNVEQERIQGRVITGKKIGLTSLPVQQMLGVDQSDFGHLLDHMAIQGGTLLRSSLLQPKVEAEIAFVLKADIQGPAATVEDVLMATDYVTAALEIVDSRIRDWRIGIVDTIADNASSGRYILGTEKVDPKSVDLKQIRMDFFKNGCLMNSGMGSATLGDPLISVAWLANTLHAQGVVLKKGEVILSGALSAMLAAEAGDDFTARFSDLGEVSVRFI